jgi:serine/threonine protein kinase/hemoglobin-like flavoprotein/Ran GTPase-activating protein (RanGAP) involved in mRNA processing and transport
MAIYCPTCSSTLPEQSDQCPSCSALAPQLGFPDDRRVGSLVAGNQYRILRRLGAGGFGVVYEVETVVGGLRRALKVLNRRWAEDPEMQERFVNEAVVLEQINHPNVARCFAAGRLDDAGDLYLLFELINGDQLAKLMTGETGEDPRPLEPMRAVRLAKQIAAGLKAAHDSGVLHRDLKPENILVTEAGQRREQAKIVDFGIAKVTEGGSTSTQSIVGTPEFMPPEQFLPGTPLDARVDLWQLGATLFFMLTGGPPYPGKGSGGIAGIMALQRKRSEAGPAPSEVTPALREHAELDQLVSQLLATDPNRRPTSAAEVCERLARIELGVAPQTVRGNTYALVGALCATPSASSWLALHGYLASQSDRVGELVAAANRLLDSWPDERRPVSNGLWQDARRGQPGQLWPLARALDLSARGLTDDDVHELADNPALATITRLNLAHNEFSNQAVQALARSPHITALRQLNLAYNRITSQGIEALAQSGHARGLTALNLAGNGIGAGGAHALAAARFRLRELDLTGNDLGHEGAVALADAVGLAELHSLSLADARIGPDGVAALACSSLLTGLQDLNLNHNAIGPGGAASLALSNNLRALRRLSLARNGLGRQGVQLLLGANALLDLREIDLGGNNLGPSGSMLLAGSWFVRRLEHLDLTDNGLGDAGVAALLGSAHLSGLRWLSLGQNGITASGASLLVDASPQLEHVDLAHNPLGDGCASALADALAKLRLSRLSVAGCELSGASLATLCDAARLCALDAARNPVGPAGAEALSAAAGLRSLEELELSHAALGPDGAAALAASPHLAGLRCLTLRSNHLGDAGINALVAGAPRLSRLELLGLEDNQLGPDAAEALAASPLSGHLTSLRLGHNELGDAGAEALAKGLGWHSLGALDLQRNGLSLAGAAALISSDRMATVHRLSLSGNPLSNTLDMYSLSQGAIDVMESSFGRIAALGADFAERFYAELFARYPGVKPLFARTSMTQQHRHLMATLVLVIDNLRTPETLQAVVSELGRRHQTYAVAPSHYYAVTSTLLDTMRTVLGDDWTDLHHDAWADGLQAVANVMMNASRARAAAAADLAAGHTQPVLPPTGSTSNPLKLQ